MVQGEGEGEGEGEGGRDHRTPLVEDSPIRRTGNIWTGVAHIITGVIGSGVLSLAWSMSQLGWIAGPLAMLLFASVTFVSAFSLCNCYRSPDPECGPKRNPSYLEAVRTILVILYRIATGKAQHLIGVPTLPLLYKPQQSHTIFQRLPLKHTQLLRHQKMKDLLFVLITCLFLLLFFAHTTQATIPCPTVSVKAGSCTIFLSGKASEPSASCCNGLQQLGQSMESVDDKKDVCRCLIINAKNVRAQLQNKFLNQIPVACKIRVGFPVSTLTNFFSCRVATTFFNLFLLVLLSLLTLLLTSILMSMLRL